MKCEIKYIGDKCKKDYKEITNKGLLITALISGIISFLLTYFLGMFIVILLLVIIFVLISFCIWKDAINYCEDRRELLSNTRIINKSVGE